MAEEHGDAVERVVLGGQHVGFADAVPVERGAHHGLGEVEVGLIVGPLALTLHTAEDGVVALGLLEVAHLGELRVAVHQVADDHHALHGELPVLVFLLAVLALALAVVGGHGRAGEEWTVLVVVVALLGLAILIYPLHSALQLVVVVDAEVHAAEDFHEVNILGADAEILLEEIGIDDTSGDTHAGVAEREIGLSSHGGHGLSGASPTENLRGGIGGDGIIGQVLHVVTIDAEGGQSLLGMGGEHGGQIDGSRALRAVESPYGLRIVGVHVHRLGAVAPAGGDGDRRAHALALELLGAGGTLSHAAYGGVGNDALHGRAVAVAQVALNQFFHGLGQTHGLLFKALTDTALATIDGGANANFWISLHISLFFH